MKEVKKMEFVIYNEEEFEIIYRYTSGYVEIKKVDSLFEIILVHSSEVRNATIKKALKL